MTKNLLIKYILKLIPFWLESVEEDSSLLKIKIHPKNLIKVIKFFKLHSNCKMESLLDVFSVDELKEPHRFSIYYQLVSYHYNIRIEIKTFSMVNNCIESVTSEFNSANWLEREIWDLMGIFFFNHPDLRRILTDYGFNGFPLRKDFPLTGYEEIRYDDELKRIVSEPVQLSQEFRFFEFRAPWTKQ
jgi:NADH dehydrogenase (ubiquinone) Fe-S protein 3